MTKRKFLSSNFSYLAALGGTQLSNDALKVLYLYTQEDLSEKDVAIRLHISMGKVRQYLNRASLIAKEKEGDPELRKAEQILHGH